MGNIDETIIMLWDKVKSISNKYSDVKDLIVNNDTTELAADTFQSIKVINNIGKLYDMIKFKHFIKGLNCDDITRQDIDKLIKYMDNQKKAEFIYSTMKKIINSNSKICCYIIGILFNEITKKNREIRQIDIAIINALGNLNDFEINNFYRLLKEYYKTNPKKIKGVYICVDEMKNFAKILQIDLDDLTLTAEVCDKNQLFYRENYADLNIDEYAIGNSRINYDDDYKITVVGKKLYELVNYYYELQKEK